MNTYTVNGREVKERVLLKTVVSTQKEMIAYERGKKLAVKPKSRLDKARDVLAVARFCLLDDPDRQQKFEAAATVIEAVENIGIEGITYHGITGITG